MPTRLWRDLLGRYSAVQEQARLIDSLRDLASLPPCSDLSEHQWSVIEQSLRRTGTRISMELKQIAREAVSEGPSIENARKLNAAVGRGEMRLSRHFDTFDMLLDVLTQRRVPSIGPLLKGCDTLAADALGRHERLSVYTRPLVFLDRGFGASILREGVPLAAGTPNVIPLIQLPYTKLVSKYGLTSLVHEAGHQALEGLGLVKPLAAAIRSALAEIGAPVSTRRIFGLWMKELGPDFWGFGACGVAQAASLREILSLPPKMVFNVVPSDPHPPPYLRVLSSFLWCRRQWGHGYWTVMERDWWRLYPLSSAPERDRKQLQEYERYLPTVSSVFFRHRFPQLGGRPVASLFAFGSVDPRRLRRIANSGVASRVLRLGNLRPCAQLALFRTIKDLKMMSASELDKLMTKWLKSLAARESSPCRQ